MSWTDVVLAWLFTRSGGSASERDLQKAFPELRGLDAWIGKLSREQLLEQRGGVIALTSKGSRAGQAALAALGVKARPRRFARDYLRQVVLPAKALGLDPAGLRLDGLKATLVARAAGTTTRSLSQARDALLWKELGIESAQRFTLKAVSLALLRRRLGSPVTDVRRALDLVASNELGAAGELRAALRGKLLSSLPGPEAQPAAGGGAPGGELQAFAQRVLAAASVCSTRFGPERVYISAVFRQLADPSLSLPDFQRRLLDASEAGLLRLARADLVEAMPADLVRASETRGPVDSTFHFVVLPRGGRP